MISSAVTSSVRVVAKAAAMLAGAAGVGHQAVLQIAERIATLEDLDRRVAAVGVAGDLAVVAILLHRRGAVTIEVVVRVVGPGHRVDAAERNCSTSRRWPRRPLRHGLTERFQQQVDQLRLEIGVAADAWSGWTTFTTEPAGAMNLIGR